MSLLPTPDRMTGAAVAIEYEHHAIHAGNSFTYEHISVAALPTVIGEETAIGFRTPLAAAGRIHMLIDVLADDESVWELREDPAIVLGSGSEVAPYNRFRDSANTSLMRGNDVALTANRITTYNVAEAAAAGLAGGTVLHYERVAIAAAAPFGSIINSLSRGLREWILAADTEYVIIVSNLTANDTNHVIFLNWYEHIDSTYKL